VLRIVCEATCSYFLYFSFLLFTCLIVYSLGGCWVFGRKMCSVLVDGFCVGNVKRFLMDVYAAFCSKLLNQLARKGDGCP
jgi:hypothetical protein